MKKIYLVTGANSGIGKVTARELARTGGTVVMVCRNRERGETARGEIIAATGNSDVQLMLADLSLYREIEKLALEFRKQYDRLDVLVNNAGALFYSYQQNAEGLEMTFALNHLGYFRLTKQLIPLFYQQGSGRIVNVASHAHQFVRDKTWPLHMGQKEYQGMLAYSRSKLANILFTRELARQLAGSGITANCLHPGFINSGFGKREKKSFGDIAFRLFAKVVAGSPEKGAETPVYLATAPEVEQVSGKYFYKKREAPVSRLARNDEWAVRLWAESEMLGVR